MKTNKFFLLLATFMVCVTSVFISCSSDDDDNNNSKEMGDKAVEALKARLLDKEGNVVFGEPNEQGFYEIGMNQEDATTLVSNYVNNANYAGGATTYKLPDARGEVSVEPGTSEGVFYKLEVRVKGIPEMTLQVEDFNYMEGENKVKLLSKYKCNKCNAEFKLPKKAAKVCPSCGKDDIEEIEK